MIFKIINTAPTIVAVFMSIKQGHAMFSCKPEMLQMFNKWVFNKTALMVNGTITVIAAFLILHLKTFV